MTETGPPDPSRWGEAFTEIYDTHRGRLVRWLTVTFGARDAEDIAQETLSRLFARPGLLAEGADAWPWLSVVARNVGRDLARHNAFSAAVDATTLDQLPADTTVHDEVVRRDDAERLHRALRRLSPRDRMLVVLRDVDEVPVGDIAAQLGLNDNAARQQLFRARRRLATVFTELGGHRRAGGLVAPFGLRVREVARKYARVAETLGPGATSVLASAAPAVAVAVSGTLFLGTGGAARDAAAPPVVAAGRPGQPDAAGAPAGPRRDPLAVTRAGAAPHAAPPEAALGSIHQPVGPVFARGWTRKRDNDYQIRVTVGIGHKPLVDVTYTEHGNAPVCRRIHCVRVPSDDPGPVPDGTRP